MCRGLMETGQCVLGLSSGGVCLVMCCVMCSYQCCSVLILSTIYCPFDD